MKKTALYVASYPNLTYSPETQEKLAQRFAFPFSAMDGDGLRKNLSLLAEVEVIFSSWGGPVFDTGLLAAAPRLEAVFHAAGSIRSLVTDAFWQRPIVISSAWAANAIPVAEFTFAQVILGLKQAWRLSRQMHAMGKPWHDGVLGAYRTRVGLIGMGMIGSLVAERLKSLDVEVWAYDPYLSEESRAGLGLRMASLEELFASCEVVSLHAPDLDSTRGMITGALLRRMPLNGTFINTARGATVVEAELIEVLQQRPDLFALLDVTFPEPPLPDSPLYTLPNVVLTPHIAGSVGQECWRLGESMKDEADRYLNAQPLRWQITAEKSRLMG
jgi:phosphoglycerate dehydrogenase-like enzyme